MTSFCYYFQKTGAILYVGGVFFKKKSARCKWIESAAKEAAGLGIAMSVGSFHSGRLCGSYRHSEPKMVIRASARSSLDTSKRVAGSNGEINGQEHASGLWKFPLSPEAVCLDEASLI
jgi:hypothetical protein